MARRLPLCSTPLEQLCHGFAVVEDVHRPAGLIGEMGQAISSRRKFGHIVIVLVLVIVIVFASGAAATDDDYEHEYEYWVPGPGQETRPTLPCGST